MGMENNGNGNTVVKWRRDKQCCLVTLLTACCSFMDCKLCSIELQKDQNLFYLRFVVLNNTLYSVSTFTRVDLQDGVGMWTYVAGTGTVVMLSLIHI